MKKGDRVTIYLPMIPEAAYAMLACARIGAVHSVVFAGFSPDSLAGRILDCDIHDRASRPTRACAAASRMPLKTNTDEALDQMPGCDERDRGEAHRRRGARCTPGATSGITRRPRRSPPIARRGDERGRSAVHSLHLRLDRKAQGRAAHHRRLSALCRLHPSICVRLSRRRYLLVHRRCRLGDGAQLYRLWPAGQRRDHPDVRRRAELSHRPRASGR